MHALDVHLQLLGLAKFTSAKVAQRFGSLGIRTATVGTVHLQIVEPQEELVAELALVGTFAVVLLDGVFHDVVLANEGAAAYLPGGKWICF